MTTILLAGSALVAAPVDSRITMVTVYSDRAVVTRTTSGDFAAGEYTLALEGLPAALSDQSLQASAKGVPGTTILEVRAQDVIVETAANDRVRALEDQIKGVRKEQRVLDDRSEILKEQRTFVQRMLQASTATPGGAAPAPPALDDWQRLFTYAEESLAKIAGAQQSIDTQREELQAREGALTQQLNDLRGARGRRSKTVSVRVALTNPGKLEVAVRYAVPNAGWSPSYDARLRSADRSIDLSYFGIVRNGTGEDWNDVDLILSTARPNLGGGAPELRPWITDVILPSATVNPDLLGEVRLVLTPTDAELGRGNTQVFTRDPGTGESSMPANTDARLAAADVESGVTSATFRIPVKVSVPGNNVSQKVPVTDVRLAATLQFQSTPKVLPAAFLSAHASNTTDYPLLAGPMNTFLDDTFIASSSLKTVMPGQEFELALGVDDAMSVKRRLVNRFSEDIGLTNKTRRITYEILITITNNKTTAERVVFKEPTPVSRNEKIVVKLLTPQEREIGTPAGPREVTREEDGKLVWRASLKPGEKREFSLKLSVEHPGDVMVAGLE